MVDLPTSHLLPAYPASQVQLKSATTSVQTPFVQGVPEQSSISIIIYRSLNTRFKYFVYFNK